MHSFCHFVCVTTTYFKWKGCEENVYKIKRHKLTALSSFFILYFFIFIYFPLHAQKFILFSSIFQTRYATYLNIHQNLKLQSFFPLFRVYLFKKGVSFKAKNSQDFRIFLLNPRILTVNEPSNWYSFLKTHFVCFFVHLSVCFSSFSSSLFLVSIFTINISNIKQLYSCIAIK